MATLYHLLPFFFFFFFILPLQSNANIHKTKLLSSQLLDSPATTPPNDTPSTAYFEVTRPIEKPDGEPCSYLVLQHDFGSTYGQPPVLANYTPPSNCRTPPNESKIVLEFTATSKGRQFDRIFGIWLGGVEILRGCTAEPRATGIVWSFEKDVTRYYSLLMKNQTLAIYMGNVVDTTYTGIYHVNITLVFYPSDGQHYIHMVDPGADFIMPISRNLPLNDGLWFEIENSTDIKLKEFEIPPNVYRAVLEVYVSFHENDEFWYANLPDNYNAKNSTGTRRNGPFREVAVSLDGEVVGAIWPFPVIYTGGINPLLWRPITGIGSFDLPSYDIELTPFLGNLLDGKSHKFGFGITNASNVWYIDANLHLWLDANSTKTTGKLLEHKSLPPIVSSEYKFIGLDGKFSVTVSRSMSAYGYVNSSHGQLSTNSSQEFRYSNTIVMTNDGNLQIVNQTIGFNDSVHAHLPESFTAYYLASKKQFPLYIYSNYSDQGNGTSLSIAYLTQGFIEEKITDDGIEYATGNLENLQNGQGKMVVENNLVKSGLGSMQQVYKYSNAEFESCYLRNVSSVNCTVTYDRAMENTCRSSRR